MIRCALLLALAMLEGGVASAATQMYIGGTLSVRSFGNDTTTGTTYPYTARVYRGIPLGREACSGYCSGDDPGMQRGDPLRGSTIDNIASASGAFPFSLPGGLMKKKLGVPATTFTYGPSGTKRPANGSPGFSYQYVPYFYSFTYADLENAPGSFYGGAGPSSGWSFTKTEDGDNAGAINVTAGSNRFGGTMNLLGFFFANTGYQHTLGLSVVLSSTWKIQAVGGGRPSTVGTGFQTTGTNFRFITGIAAVYTEFVVATAFPWTTGTASVTATRGTFHTRMKRTGYDTRDENGSGHIQMVSPMLTHWTCPACGTDYESGAIGVLNLTFVPEPDHLLQLMAGISALYFLYRNRSGV